VITIFRRLFGRRGSQRRGEASGTVRLDGHDESSSRRRAQVSTNDGPGVPPEGLPERTSVFRADFLSEVEPTETPAPEPSVAGVDALPTGSALLVVKRGPNAGSRFLLDRDTTSAGRHPDSDIFLVGTPSSAARAASSSSATSAASTAPTSTASRSTRRCLPMATRCRSASSGWCSSPVPLPETAGRS
jgi:hypothetical protein